MSTSTTASAQSWLLNRFLPGYGLARVFDSNRAISIYGTKYQLINFTDRTVSEGNIDLPPSLLEPRSLLDAFEFADGSIEVIYSSKDGSRYYMVKITTSGMEKPKALPVSKEAVLAGVLENRFLVFSDELEIVAIDCLALNPNGDLSIKEVARPYAGTSRSLACIVIPGTSKLIDVFSKKDETETVVVLECRLALQQITRTATWETIYKGNYQCLSLSRDEKTGQHFVWTLGNGSNWLEQHAVPTGELIRAISEPEFRISGTRPPDNIFVGDNGCTLEVTNYRGEDFGHFDLESTVRLIDIKPNKMLLGRTIHSSKKFRVAYTYIREAPIPITVVDESDESVVDRIEMPHQSRPYLVEGPTGAVYLFGSELNEIYELNKSNGKLRKVDLKSL